MNDRPGDPGADALGAYWDWLNAGDSGPRPPLDAGSRAEIARLARLDGRREPTPSFVRSLREELMSVPATIPLDGSSPVQPARVTVVAPASERPASASRSRPRALLSQIGSALAAAVLLVLVSASLFALRGGTPGDGEQAAILPAASVASPAPPSVTDETVLARTVASYPADWDYFGVERFQIAPGATLSTGTYQTLGEGHWLAMVVTGQLTLTPAGPAWMLPAGSGTEQALAGGQAVTLAPGDRGYVPPGTLATWSNTGSETAEILTVELVHTDMGSSVVQLGVTEINGVYRAMDLPPAPLTVTLRRVTLPPGATLLNDPPAAISMIWVETGTVEVEWSSLDAPGTPTGKPMAVPAGGKLDVHTGRYDAHAITNPGTEPATFLLLTADPATEPATPAAG